MFMLRRVSSLLGIAVLALSMTACSKSDPGITTAVKTKLAADDTVKAYKIDVDTRNAVVTLTGSVDSADAKTRAVQLARATKGVTDVVDQLAVAPAAVATSGASEPLADPAITTAVKTSLLADPQSADLKIDVDTEHGVVTLTGTVVTPAEKTRAEEVAKNTSGVSSVVNNLKVTPKKD
jgi:hyperosmotically inducible protein